MKTAMEIAQIAKTANKNLVAERHDRTMRYINETMVREVEKRANVGELSIKFRVSPEVDRKTIERVFVEKGFEVTVKGYEIKISWMHQYFKIEG